MNDTNYQPVRADGISTLYLSALNAPVVYLPVNTPHNEERSLNNSTVTTTANKLPLSLQNKSNKSVTELDKMRHVMDGIIKHLYESTKF